MADEAIPNLTKEKLLILLRRLGAAAKSPGDCFLVGGTSALLVGWRDSTVDVDIKLDPEPEGVFEAIPQLKRELAVNIELAAPDDFIPRLHQWRERSLFIDTYGEISFYHYDFVAQALAKICRGHARDVSDVQAMVERSLVTETQIRSAFTEIKPLLCRYPSIDEDRFEQRVQEFLASLPKQTL